MKRYIPAVIIAFLCLGLFSCSPAPQEEVQARSGGEELITVLTPLGHPPDITLKPMAPRLDTIEGKTVYILDNIYPGSDLILTEMQAWFEREMPNTTAVYRRKSAYGGGFEAVDQALWTEIEENADAVIIGLGH